MIIAIDGPAASGKGTLGRRLAAQLGFHHLDTGLLYRGVAARLLAVRSALSEEAAVAAAGTLIIEKLNADELSAPDVGEAASRIAALPALRATLVDRQRVFSVRPPGAVLDGRDIGTVICPSAEVKIFLDATPQVRARRRAAQQGIDDAAGVQAILDDIRRRDERDTNRPIAPLRQAADAYLLDTSDMDIEAAFRAALAIVEDRRKKPG